MRVLCLSQLKTTVAALSIYLAGCLFASCAHRRGAATDVRPGGPLTSPLGVLLVDGVLQGRFHAGIWRPLKPDTVLIHGLRALRVSGSGAILVWPSHTGERYGSKLWLRGGSELRLGQRRGRALLHLVAGELRLRHERGQPLLLHRARGAAMAIDRRDVIVTRAAGGEIDMRSTAQAGQDADWTFALADGGTPTAGLGSLRVHDRHGVATQLRLRKVWVKAQPAGDAAETVVEHVFFNPSAERLEGIFRFPLPSGVSLIGLAMEIDGKRIEGELVERHKARRAYETIVESMRDPALLEWTQGNTFKLRVFPIEPRSEKRIILRYIAPLARSSEGLSYRYDTAATAMQRHIDRFRLDVAGKTVIDQKGFAAGRAILVPLADRPSVAYRETKKDATYTLFRVKTPWLAARPAAARRRDVVLIVDTSRSALESRELALQSLRAILDGLRRDDRFVVLASDLTTRGQTSTFVENNAATRSDALQFIKGIESDGASDLGAALAAAGTFIRQSSAGSQLQVVYLGDGTATWGETGEKELRELAGRHLGQTPFFALVLGKGASRELLAQIAGQQGGRVARPDRRLDTRRFALALAEAPGLERLRQIRLRAGDHDLIYPQTPVTLFAGDELEVLIRTPAGKRPPSRLTIEGQVGDQHLSRSIVAMRVAPSAHIARRWARRHIAYLQNHGGDKDEIVKASLKHGVLSRHTAFLVLESEAAYKRHKIVRRKKAEAERRRRISGADLESVGARQASLSPDHLQPGDPEVRIPAPADAKSVVVVFPFGETKIARYERDLKAWTVRFLVDKDTPDGTYQVTVRIKHADDRVELLKLSYVVDTQAPMVAVTVKRVRGRGRRALYTIVARQIVTKIELEREARRWAIGGKRIGADAFGNGGKTMAELVWDAKRIDLLAPDGRLITLRAMPGGTFRTYWRARTSIDGPLVFKIVAVDKAYNRKVLWVKVDATSGAQTVVAGEARP